MAWLVWIYFDLSPTCVQNGRMPLHRILRQVSHTELLLLPSNYNLVTVKLR